MVIIVYLHILIDFLFTLVPPPNSVTITSNPASPIQPFVSPNVTLTCTVKLSSMNISVSVNTVWTGPEYFYSNEAVQQSNTTYISTTIVSSFGRNQSGNYTCTARVISVSLSLNDSLPQLDIKRITTGKIRVELE